MGTALSIRATRRAWASPYYVGIHQYYFNMDAFDEAGLDYPKAGWTVDDYSVALEKLVQKDDSGTITRWGGMETTYNNVGRLQLWMNIFGGEIVDPDDWTHCVISSEESKAAFEWHRKRLWDDNTLIQVSQLGELGNLDPLATGKVGIQGEGNGSEGLFLASAPGFRWACAAPPTGPAGEPVGNGTCDNWGIWKGSKAPDVVWDLMKIVALEDEFQLGFAALWVATPNRKSLLPKFKEMVKQAYPDATDEQIDPQIEQLTGGTVRQRRQFKQHKASLEILQPAIQQILITGTAGPEVLDAACEEVTALNREA